MIMFELDWDMAVVMAANQVLDVSVSAVSPMLTAEFPTTNTVLQKTCVNLRYAWIVPDHHNCLGITAV